VSDIRVIKNGASLVSIQKTNLTIKWIFKNELLEVLTLEMGPKSLLEEPYIYQSQGIHHILDGELIFETERESYQVKKGDIIWWGSGASFRIKNLNNFKGVIYTLLLKPEFQADASDSE
jgi:mannose-6-phosphate isomerase-like protein (cupin superfamily)